jgi:hypothetical protein
MQRCIAPCQAGLPEVDPIEGTWTGTLTYEGQSIGICFVLAQDAGKVEGRLLMEDPVSKEFLESGPVMGDYSVTRSNLYLESGSYATGTFEGESFSGEFIFAPAYAGESLTATLVMQRQ